MLQSSRDIQGINSPRYKCLIDCHQATHVFSLFYKTKNDHKMAHKQNLKKMLVYKKKQSCSGIILTKNTKVI
jgi:hypothetical protein